jgi:phosphonatase-like hydrolase
MGTIQLVVFDMAGTTVQDHDEVLSCFLSAAAATGLAAEPEQVNPMMGWAKKRVFQALWNGQIGAEHPDYKRRVDQSFTDFKQRLEDHYRTQPVESTEGCLETFDWLRSHQIKIALNTGFYREVTNIILNRLGWDNGLNSDYVGNESSVIQSSITPSEIYGQEGRPAPYMIQKAMYQLGIKDPQAVECPLWLCPGRDQWHSLKGSVATLFQPWFTGFFNGIARSLTGIFGADRIIHHDRF